ncbi:MAG: hypothetical protein JW761_08050 [Prolixibacteraceae bacterium]|nr:hypothetical protein [Prolixibacteraceae bacterium]
MNFIYFNWTPILFPFFAGLFLLKYFNKSLKLAFYFVCFGTFTEVLARLLIWLADVNNTMPVNNIYSIGSFILLFALYYYVLNDFVNRRVFLLLSAAFTIYWLIHSLFIQSIFEFPDLPRAIGNIYITILSIIYFYKVMLEAKIIKLAREPFIWINTSILIYYTGNLFFYILFNLILDYSREFSKITVIYFSLLNALFYFLIGIGFLKVNKSPD